MDMHAKSNFGGKSGIIRLEMLGRRTVGRFHKPNGFK
ncbi:hypothetical protein QFZ77_003518 [Paenibacillus sp. V4I3]|nr:hypothetical protein [Paenibacillus sp. V4I3]MDQ0889390.1 hypothetical protein [Paenibacillus sp. V4I9]